MVGRLPDKPAGGGFDPAAGHLGEPHNKGSRMPLSLYRDTCQRRRWSDPAARANELRLLFDRRERALTLAFSRYARAVAGSLLKQ